MMMVFAAFSQRSNGKANNEDAMLLNGEMHQGRIR